MIAPSALLHCTLLSHFSLLITRPDVSCRARGRDVDDALQLYPFYYSSLLVTVSVGHNTFSLDKQWHLSF